MGDRRKKGRRSESIGRASLRGVRIDGERTTEVIECVGDLLGLCEIRRIEATHPPLGTHLRVAISKCPGCLDLQIRPRRRVVSPRIENSCPDRQAVESRCRFDYHLKSRCSRTLKDRDPPCIARHGRNHASVGSDETQENNLRPAAGHRKGTHDRDQIRSGHRHVTIDIRSRTTAVGRGAPIAKQFDPQDGHVRCADRSIAVEIAGHSTSPRCGQRNPYHDGADTGSQPHHSSVLCSSLDAPLCPAGRATVNTTRGSSRPTGLVS
jgi:hypothetical protein